MHRIIVDTDVAMGAPGSDIDDGFALALAIDLADQQLELVTTVNGNTDVDTSTLLAVDLLQPLHDHPARERVAGVRERLSHHKPAPGRAATAIIEHIMANPGEITLV